MKNLQQLRSSQIERVLRLRESLTKLGAPGFFDSVEDTDWKILEETKGFPSWLAFAMPKESFWIKMDGHSFLMIYSLEGFLSTMSHLEFTQFFSAYYYPIANTMGGGLLAVEGTSSHDFTIVSISWEAQCYCTNSPVYEIAHHLKEDYQGLLDMYISTRGEYQSTWEWLIGDKGLSFDELQAYPLIT